MQIKDIEANKGNIDIVAKVVAREQPRSFNKFGKEGKVCNIKIQDDSGEIKVTLWNDDTQAVTVGDTIHLANGWCSEYKGEKQLSTGKFGKIEIVEKAAAAAATATPVVFTNDERMLKSSKKLQSGDDEDEGDDSTSEDTEEERITDEELIE